MRGQYEREKKLLDEKVRQLAELESSQKDAKAMAKENSNLKKLNQELNSIVKDYKLKNDMTEKTLSQ